MKQSMSDLDCKMDPGPCLLGSDEAEIALECGVQEALIRRSAPEVHTEAASRRQNELDPPGKGESLALTGTVSNSNVSDSL